MFEEVFVINENEIIELYATKNKISIEKATEMINKYCKVGRRGLVFVKGFPPFNQFALLGRKYYIENNNKFNSEVTRLLTKGSNNNYYFVCYIPKVFLRKWGQYEFKF